jgi:hypothetical protein
MAKNTSMLCTVSGVSRKRLTANCLPLQLLLDRFVKYVVRLDVLETRQVVEVVEVEVTSHCKMGGSCKCSLQGQQRELNQNKTRTRVSATTGEQLNNVIYSMAVEV